jgi:hypothetical protein
MAASNARHDVESLALLVHDDAVPLDAAARTQVAFVLALIDEIDRRAPTDPSVAPLLAQLEEEIDRLAHLVAPGAGVLALRRRVVGDA